MIIEGRRYTGFEMYKVKHARAYILAWPGYEHYGGDAVRQTRAPLGTGVTTDHVRAANESGIPTRLSLCWAPTRFQYLAKYCYPVSWARTPEPWRRRYLYDLIQFDEVHPFGEGGLRSSDTPDALEAWRRETFLQWLQLASRCVTGDKEQEVDRDYERAGRVFFAVSGFERFHSKAYQGVYEIYRRPYDEATLGIKVAKEPLNIQIEKARCWHYEELRIPLDYLSIYTEHEVVRDMCDQYLISTMHDAWFKQNQELTSALTSAPMAAATT